MRNMTVVISDLHFEEEKKDIISDPSGAQEPINFRRNVPAVAFEDMMRDVADQARTNGAARIDFVLAGDVFDLYRTQLWFENDTGVRPYCDNDKVRPALETKLLSILDGIAAEADVGRSLKVFSRFQRGFYLGDSTSEDSEVAFGMPTQLHYLPGNHDRLANATPAIRNRVRSLLGMPAGEEPFPHYILSADPPVLIRHGHEYDRYNFGEDLSHTQIKPDLPIAWYNAATWGDYNTVAIAARLPFLFRQVYPDPLILGDLALQVIYCRILEFDDVRPQSAVLDFFLNTTVPVKFPNEAGPGPRPARAPGAATPGDIYAHREDLQRAMWAKITPVIRRLRDEVLKDPYFRSWSWKLFTWKAPLLFLLLRFLPLNLWIARRVGRWLRKHRNDAGDGKSSPETFAAHEIAVHGGQACFVCAGHTHKPQVAHIFTRNDLKRFYTDTGTWRNAVLSAGDERSYGRVNATTYVTFYGREADPCQSSHPDHGFEFWTGYGQNWPVDGHDH